MSASKFAIECVHNVQDRIKKILSDKNTKMSSEVRNSLLESFDDLHRVDVCLNMRKEECHESKQEGT